MNPLSPELETLCAAAQQYGASDLLLHEDQVPRFRVNARLAESDYPPLNEKFFRDLWDSCGAASDVTDFDGSITSAEGIRFRVNLLRQLGRHAAVLRRIRSDIPDLAVLGLPDGLLESWCVREAGIILVCGPTGSGKSTTLAAALQWVNHRSTRHVVSIEDPVEYLFKNDQCLFTQREVGIDTPSFSEGLRRAMRQNPDVILVGEIRDASTAITAIQAAETGHLVLATVHASSCPDAVERLQLLFPPQERDGVGKTLAGQLVGIVCQRLLSGTNGGVQLALEYFTNVGVTRKYVSENKLAELADFLSRSEGVDAMSYLSSLVKLIKGGAITEEVGMASVDQPQELQRAMRGISSSSRASRI